MLSISHRGFVAGAVAGVAGSGARAATPGALTLTQQGRSVVMEGPDAARWRIDLMRSSPDSRADIVLPRRAADGETLTLDTGTVLVEVGGFVLPGGPLVRLEFRYTHHSSGWRVRAEWTLQPGGRRSVSRSVPLGGLSSGRTFDIPLGCQRMGELVRECAGRALQAREAGVLEIDQALRVVLSARDGRFTGSGGVRLRTLLLAPAPAGADGSWLCDGVAEPVEGLLGRNWEKTGVWLRFDTPAVTVRRSPKPLEIAGRGELAIEVPSRPAVKLPVMAARLGQDGAALDAEITLEQARGRLPTPLGTLDYEVGVEAPVATVSVRSGRIGAFRMELSARALNLKVPDVDRSRLDFAGQRLAVRLAGLEEEGDGTGLVLGRGEPGFRIGLENASLQVFRGADLMQLTFRFSGMTLGVGTKEEPAPRITTAWRPETGPMPACGPVPAVPDPLGSVGRCSALRDLHDRFGGDDGSKLPAGSPAGGAAAALPSRGHAALPTRCATDRDVAQRRPAPDRPRYSVLSRQGQRDPAGQAGLAGHRRRSADGRPADHRVVDRRRRHGRLA